MRFPFDPTASKRTVHEQLEKLGHDLMADYRHRATPKIRIQKTTGRMELQEIDPRKSKAIIDEIDKALAAHYGFTDEELDFIINYDIKYRMGGEAGGAGDGEE